MWESGSTASQIAEELTGVSRNAVIGKAHRLGLKARPFAGQGQRKGSPRPRAGPATRAQGRCSAPPRPRRAQGTAARRAAGHPDR